MLKKTIGLFLILFCLPLFGFAKPSVVLATTQWEPYISTNAKYHGYAYEIVKAAYEQAGYQVTIKFMPWDKALRAAKKGQVDAVFPEYYSKTRLKNWEYSKDFSGGPIGFFKKKGSAVQLPAQAAFSNEKTILAKLSQYTFGVVKDYINFPAFDNNHNLKKRFVKSDRANLEQLYRGKVQLIVIDKFTADYILSRQLPPKVRRALEFMSPAMAYRKLYIAIPRTNSRAKTILQAFNKGLKTISQNGVMSKIMDKDAQLMGVQYA